MATWLVAVRAWLRSNAADLFIALAVLVAYWPLVVLKATLPLGDTMDCWLPWRWFIASSIQDGSLPWWNPLQQMGYPVHADLQGPAWYVEAIATAGTIGQGPIVLQYLLLAYLIIGGWGMRRMTVALGGGSAGSALAGTCYALSGFFTGHAMHFFAVISAAWTPWALAALLGFLDAPNWRTMLRTALLLALLLTGGNHGLLIMCAYPMGLLTLHRLWSVRHDRASTIQLLGWGLLILISASLMAAGTLHAVWEVRDHVTRLGGLGLEQAQVNPLSPRSFLALILPQRAVGTTEALGTDPTMANTYFGVMALAFALVGGIGALRGRVLLLALVGLLSACAALGPHTPVHAFLWANLPGMDLFRFPGYFWYLTLIAVLPLAALGWERVSELRVRRVTAAVLLALGGLLVVDGIRSGIGAEAWSALVRAGSIPDEGAPAGGLAHMLTGCLVMSAGLLLAWNALRPQVLLVLVALEGIVVVHATRSATAMFPLDPRILEARLSEYPKGPVLPDGLPMGANKDGEGPVQPLWRNTRTFQGGASHDGFNSFWLNPHQQLTSEWPRLHATLLERPLFSLARTVHPQEGFVDAEIDPLRDKDIVLVPASAHRRMVPGLGMDRISVRGGDHRAWTLDVHADGEAFLLVQQSHYPGWRITVDGVHRPIIPANVAAFGTWLGSGDHRVTIAYDRPFLTWLFLVGHGTWFLGLFALVLSGSRCAYHLIPALVLFLAWGWAMVVPRSKASDLEREWQAIDRWASSWPGVPLVVNSDRPLPETTRSPSSFRIDAPDRVNPLVHEVEAQGADSVLVAWHGTTLTTAMRTWLLGRYGRPHAQWTGRHAGAWLMVNRGTPPGLDTLFNEGRSSALFEAAPFSPAFRFLPDTLNAPGKGYLVVHARYSAKTCAQCRLVIEQRRDDRVLSYEAVPLEEPVDGKAWNSLMVVRPTAGLLPGSEWGAYLWNPSNDTLKVQEWSVMAGEVKE